MSAGAKYSLVCYLAGVLVVICVVLLASQRAFAQTSANTGDVLTSLLSEVHALRVAVERASSSGPRVQLTIARLDSEYKRLVEAERALAGVEERLSRGQAEMSRRTEEAASIDVALGGPLTDVHQREQYAERSAILRKEIESQQDVMTRLIARQADCRQEVDAARSRYSAVSQQLEQLQRDLSPPLPIQR
jgi:predicted  nucleic acid-binding Zn-ribbon protein